MSKVLTPQKLRKNPAMAYSIVIVTKNMERFIVILVRIAQVAKRLGQPVICFPLPLTGQVAKFLSPELTQRLRDDFPQLYGFFVRGLSGVMDVNMRNELGVSNGCPFLYHSLCLEKPGSADASQSSLGDGSGFDNGVDDMNVHMQFDEDDLAEMGFSTNPDDQAFSSLLESTESILLSPSSTAPTSALNAGVSAASADAEAPLPASMLSFAAQLSAAAKSPTPIHEARDVIISARPGSLVMLNQAPYTVNILLPNHDVNLFRGISLSDQQVIIPLTCCRYKEMPLPTYVLHRMPTWQARVGSAAEDAPGPGVGSGSGSGSGQGQGQQGRKKSRKEKAPKLYYFSFGANPALAITFHKSQGSTKTFGVLCLENSPQPPFVTHPTFFVGISRMPLGDNCGVLPVVMDKHPFQHLDSLSPPEDWLIFLCGFAPIHAADGQPTYQLIEWQPDLCLEAYIRVQDHAAAQKAAAWQRAKQFKETGSSDSESFVIDFTVDFIIDWHGPCIFFIEYCHLRLCTIAFFARCYRCRRCSFSTSTDQPQQQHQIYQEAINFKFLH